jgi:hypothetical protein
MHYMEEEIARLSHATLVVSKNLAHNRMGCAFSTKNQMTLVYAVILARLVDCFHLLYVQTCYNGSSLIILDQHINNVAVLH